MEVRSVIANFRKIDEVADRLKLAVVWAKIHFLTKSGECEGDSSVNESKETNSLFKIVTN